MIPPAVVDQIREAVDILDIIGGYVSLRKQGGNFFGLCPFHTEKTPSFSVNQARQIFHCFGCGEGGNVYTFLMKVERTTFPEAVELLARRAGITIPRSGKPGEVRREDFYEVNERAARWFQDNLDHPAVGARAREYLDRRGISPAIREAFRLGYAPDQWEALQRAFGAERKVLAELGLIVAKDRGEGHYDRFRDRLMFPIRNELGRVVGFGGRVIAPDAKGAKYMNSPESVLYQKGRLLYGLFGPHPGAILRGSCGGVRRGCRRGEGGAPRGGDTHRQ